MSVITYNQLALDWQPTRTQDRRFLSLTVGALALMLIVALVLSAIPVPEPERRQRSAVPERVARFIADKPKPPKPIEAPKPKPVPPPKLEPQPTVRRERPQQAERQPLTEAQQSAREKAQNSGLLALQSEMADLMDTSEVSGLVRGAVGSETAADTSAGHDLAAITESTARGGDGVDSNRYGSRVSATKLSAREIAAVQSELFAGGVSEADAEQGSSEDDSSGSARSREDVTVVFDQNKGSLYSLYARERRRSPGLQGKIVLKITIAPSGSVTDVQIVSSELNNASLEEGIIGRIKLFKFEPMDVDEMTVTYPIEFLPS